jgi:hypothetical protein|tara:strand:+ start:54 stop:1202 length:1149 start_codon:yes stop_codon:yes gene_type:complete
MPPLKLDLHDIGYTYSFPPSIDEGGDSLTDEKYRAVLSFNPVKVDAVTVGSLIGKDSYLGKILSGEIANLSDLADEYKERLIKKEREQAGYPGSSNTKEDAKAKGMTTSLKAKRSTENTTVRGKGKDDLGYPDNRYVHLYMPMNIQQNESVVAGPEQLGIAGGMVAGTLMGAGTTKTVADIASSAFKGTFAGIGELMEGKTAPEFGSLIANRLVSKLSTNAGNATSLATRIAVNPNTRALFKQVNIREWNFVFQMIPTSPDETKRIENIIDFFRTEQLPTELVSEGTGVGMAYRFPNLMHIKALYRDERTNQYKPILTRFLPAYLQAVDVTYNTQAMSFYEGGKFHDATMSLKFIEYRPLNKDDIDVERKYLGKGDKIRHGV